MGKDALKKTGLKVTAPRVRILQMLEEAENRHLSAEDIYRHLSEKGEDIGLATVYRVLIRFEDVGIVKRHNFEGDHFVFELDRGQHHDHLVCTGCGQVEEFFDEVIESRQQKIADEAGFVMQDHALNIYGQCKGCQS